MADHPPAILIVEQRPTAHYVGPYVIATDGAQTVFYRDPIPDDVRVALDALRAVHKAMAPTLRAYYGVEAVTVWVAR